jgi:hypothetical protein
MSLTIESSEVSGFSQYATPWHFGADLRRCIAFVHAMLNKKRPKPAKEKHAATIHAAADEATQQAA